jgi:peptidoglycan-N-acetylglucosamine deacetylase
MMITAKSPKFIGGLIFFIAVCLILLFGLLQLIQHHKVPMDRVLNPMFWVRHLRGEDRYNVQTALLEHGNPAYREVALTIDDGPDPRYGPQIAALLKQDNVPATFFLVGIRVKQYPQVVTQIARDGFEIGNHTYDHQRLDALKPHEIANELRLCDSHIAAITGKHTSLMRPPGVQYNDKVLQVAKALGYVTISWTAGAHDYDTEAADTIAQRVIDRTESGSIIILHQDTPSTIQALPLIIDSLRRQKYQFVTISEMLRHLNARLPSPQH